MIAPLACSLAGQSHPVRIQAGSRAGQLYGVPEVVEPFFCSFGLNDAYRPALERHGLRFVGFDDDGSPRVLELPGHPFFLATLYVPQAASTPERPHPLLAGFLRACGQAVAAT